MVQRYGQGQCESGGRCARFMPGEAEMNVRLFWLTVLAMLAFAGNSLLNRMAVAPGTAQGGMGAVDFAVLRLCAGAVALAALLALRRRGFWPGWAGRGAGVIGLLLYLFGFSLAYVDLAAGIGALVLFGMVQITMFAGAVLAQEPVPGLRWLGAGVAFGGLVVLLAPGGDAVAVWPMVLMAVAGVGWGVYSLAGRGARDPLAATAANFCLAVPVALLAVAWQLDPAGWNGQGVALAVISGAVTSGLGYALWYRVVPQLGASRAGVAQLSVPVLAALAGAWWLAEPLGLRFIMACCLVLGGVALASFGGRKA